MPVQFTVLQLFDAARGSLVEVELTHSTKPRYERRWLWIEASWVILLHLVSDRTPFLRVFDQAVLVLDGERGELRWPSGQRDMLLANPGDKLRPDFLRLVHQHLN